MKHLGLLGTLLLILACVGLVVYPLLASESSKFFVFFTAKWCVSCQKMKKELGDQDALIGYRVVLVDIDKYPQLAKKYNIKCVPTYIILDKNRKELKRGEGYRTPDELGSWIRSSEE